MLLINEVFLSIQGEGKFTGYPTIFVRLTGCNLRCSYCDTKYSYNEGKYFSEEEIFSIINEFGYNRVCITGGEPLTQDLSKLLKMLNENNVSIETNGSILLNQNILFSKHSYIMDVKAPSSGCSDSINFKNFDELNEQDEIKVVIGNRKDYEWTRNLLRKYYKKGNITYSCVYGMLDNKELISWILEDKLDVRFQVQLHKVIWSADKRGV